MADKPVVSQKEGVRDEEIIRDILSTLTKTVKTFNVYPKDNPIYQRFATSLYEKFQEFFEKSETLRLDVQHSSLLFDGSEVFRGEDTTDNIAVLLYADGIRQLSFLSGITLEEIIDFIDILRQAPKAETLHDDIVTLLWEKDIGNLSYMVAEEGVEGFDLEEELGGDAEGVTLYGASYSDLTIKPIRLDLGTSPVTSEEIMAVETELMELDEEKLLSLASDLLFDLLPEEREMTGYAEMIRNLGEVTDLMVRKNELGPFLHVLGKLREVYKGLKTPEQRKPLNELFERAGGLDTLRKLLKSEVKEQYIRRYIYLIGRSIIPRLVEMLGENEDRRRRKFLCDILAKVGKADLAALTEGLSDKRWFLVRNLIIVLGLINDPSTVRALERTLTNPDPRVRREAVRAIDGMSSPDVMRPLATAMYDEDLHVRIAAAKALRRFGGKEAFNVLSEIILTDEFRRKSYSEKRELLGSIAAVGGMAAMPILADMFRKRGLIEKEEVTETRAATAFGLGMVATPEAMSLLGKETGSRKALLKDACLKALKEAAEAKSAQPGQPGSPNAHKKGPTGGAA